MWTCENCGRVFKKINQSHFCSDAPRTIDVYIDEQEESIRRYLHEIRDTISSALPDAVEKISWSMPTWWKGHNIIHFAAAKKHIGIYPGPDAVKHFEERLKALSYKFTKGSIQIPYADPLPLDLISDIAKYCMENVKKEEEYI